MTNISNQISANDSTSKQAKNQRIFNNTIILFVRIFLLTIINLYTVRFVLKGLGREDYGIFNAVVGVVMTFACVFPVLAVSVQRFYSYTMVRNGKQQLQEIFSASVNIIAVSLVVILILLETVGILFIHTKFQIPESRMDEAIWTFQCALFIFAFSYLQIPYSAALFAHEDMKIYAYISSIDCFLKLIIALLISKSPYDRLLFYVTGLVFVAFCTWILYFIGCRKYKECRYTKVKSSGIYKKLLSFSGWTMYGAFAGMGMIQGNNILLNVFFGPLSNAAFGVANSIYNAYTSLGNTVVLSFRPQMIKSYAAKDLKYLNLLFSVNNKFILYLMTGISIPIVMEMDFIMKIWLTEVSEEMVLFSRLFIIYTVLLAMHNPITTIIQSIGRIRNYHLIVESITILCLPITWILFSLGMPSYVAFISMITLCVLAHVARLACLAYYYKEFSLNDYLNGIIFHGFIVVVLGASVATMLHYWMEAGLLRLFVMFIFSPSITFCLAFCIGLTSQERILAINMVRRLFKR